MPAGLPSGFLASAGPHVFAHRGLAVGAPENTLAAFRDALSAGATHLETDVQVSADGIAVISHDADLVRLTGSPGRISALTLSELQRIELGAGQSFASLGEALSKFPAARFNIDVKSDAAAEPTARAVLAAGATDRVLITSFNEVRRRRAVSMLPGVATSASAPVVLRAVLAAGSGLDWPARRVLRGFAAVQVPERAGSIRILTPRFVRAMHAQGVAVHVWTVNEPDAMRRLLDLGIDGIVTDRCDLAVAVIAERV
jgi:glycerophosphoryl diester phosphodiesterase